MVLAAECGDLERSEASLISPRSKSSSFSLEEFAAGKRSDFSVGRGGAGDRREHGQRIHRLLVPPGAADSFAGWFHLWPHHGRRWCGGPAVKAVL